MRRSTLLLLTAVTMVAFAANSVLGRLALRHTGIDPVSFTATRLGAAALVLWLLMQWRGARVPDGGGSWTSALSLFAYAAAFSFAYVALPTGIGALLLFGAVQATMMGYGLWRGERPGGLQALGMAVAALGLVGLVLPHGTVAPPSPLAAGLMLVSGTAWGVYSLRGRSAPDAAAATQGNFARSLPFAAAMVLAGLPGLRLDGPGLALAALSGGVTSALGYIAWYTVAGKLQASQAATVQLSVPLIAAAAGVLLLGETMTPLQLGAGAAIVGGIWLSLLKKAQPA